jgi:TM2 domain-containing membrane protein YozV
MIILGVVLCFVSVAVIANAQREVDLVQGAIRTGNVEAAGRLAGNAYDAQQRMGIAGIVGLVGAISFIAGIIILLVRVSSNPSRQRSNSTRTQTPKKTTAILLALFFGGLGIHLFYVGRKNEGLVFLLLFILTGPTVIIPLILVILSVVHIFQFAALDDESWEEQYGGYI